MARRHLRPSLGHDAGVLSHFVSGPDDELVCVALSNVGPTPVDDMNDALLLAPRLGH